MERALGVVREARLTSKATCFASHAPMMHRFAVRPLGTGPLLAGLAYEKSGDADVARRYDDDAWALMRASPTLLWDLPTHEH